MDQGTIAKTDTTNMVQRVTAAGETVAGENATNDNEEETTLEQVLRHPLHNFQLFRAI